MLKTIREEITNLVGSTAFGEFERANDYEQPKLIEFFHSLADMDERQLVETTASAIHESALAQSFRGNWEGSHAKASACYFVCIRRDMAKHAEGCPARGNLYKRAYNMAVSGQGHSTDKLEICTCDKH